jgi:hypothetical protein
MNVDRKRPTIVGEWLKEVAEQILYLRKNQYIEIPKNDEQKILNYDKLVEHELATREDLGDKVRYDHTLDGFIAGDRLLTIRKNDK